MRIINKFQTVKDIDYSELINNVNKCEGKGELDAKIKTNLKYNNQIKRQFDDKEMRMTMKNNGKRSSVGSIDNLGVNTSNIICLILF